MSSRRLYVFFSYSDAAVLGFPFKISLRRFVFHHRRTLAPRIIREPPPLHPNSTLLLNFS
jgi:hypothetical protein